MNGRRQPINHGTGGGYRAHFRHGVPLCDPCRRAHALGDATRQPRAYPPPRTVPTAIEAWRDAAACLGHKLPPATWDDYPGFGQREDDVTRAKRTAAAKAVCWTECTVREACLAAVDLDADEGIRGGKDLRELRAARKGKAS